MSYLVEKFFGYPSKKYDLWDDMWNVWNLNTDYEIKGFKPLKSDDGKYFYRLDLPGYTKESLVIEQENNLIKIKGESENPYIKEDKRVFDIILNTSYDIDTAKYINGVLYIFLKVADSTKRIDVK